MNWDTIMLCPYKMDNDIILLCRLHLNFVMAKHSGRQFISDKQRFTAGMLRPYEYIFQNEMYPLCPYTIDIKS